MSIKHIAEIPMESPSMGALNTLVGYKNLAIFDQQFNSNKILIGNIYRSPNSSQNNDDNLYELLEYLEQNFNTPKLLVGDFNFSNIDWYPVQSGASARCCKLSENDMRFINSLRENLFIQHVVKPTRQRGSDTPHTYLRFCYYIR